MKREGEGWQRGEMQGWRVEERKRRKNVF